MGKIDDLAKQFDRHICQTWQRTLSGAQRVIMVVYEKDLERTFRARKEIFAQCAIRENIEWKEIDVTRAFAEWMAADEYRDAYFESPADLDLKLEAEFATHVAERIRATLRECGPRSIVALIGVASLYGFLHVSQLVRSLEPDIRGRLAVFFPGTKEGNNYQLLDARDGWNYLAIGITLHG